MQSHFESANIPLTKARHTLSPELKGRKLHPTHPESQASHMPIQYVNILNNNLIYP